MSGPLDFDECIKWLKGCSDMVDYQCHLMIDECYLVITRVFNSESCAVCFLPLGAPSIRDMLVDEVNCLIVSDKFDDALDAFEEFCDRFMGVHGYVYQS